MSQKARKTTENIFSFLLFGDFSMVVCKQIIYHRLKLAHLENSFNDRKAWENDKTYCFRGDCVNEWRLFLWLQMISTIISLSTLPSWILIYGTWGGLSLQLSTVSLWNSRKSFLNGKVLNWKPKLRLMIHNEITSINFPCVWFS